MHVVRVAMSSFLGRAVLLFALLMLPWPGLAGFYGGLVANLANAVVGTMGPPVRLECSAAPADGPAKEWDLRVRAEESESGRFVDTAVNLRRGGYLASALFVALAFASPLRRRRKAVIIGIGFAGLQVLPLLPIVSFFSGSLPIVAFHLNAPEHWLIEMLYRSLVAPPGMAYAVPLLLWLALVWAVEPTALYSEA